LNRAELIERLDGVFVPMFTPFTANGAEINEKQLRANTRYLIERGIRILNPAGTTGEFWTLTPDEHRRLLRCVIEEARAADPDVIVVAGVSTPNVKLTIELARFAGDCGSQILQITPPYYLPSSPDDVVAYYKTVCDQVGVPVMPYEIPPATGVRLRGDLLAKICDACPNVLALKTASPADAPREFERIVRRFGKRLRIFAATGAYYSTFTYMTGIAGITDTMANVAPAFGLSLHDLARARRWEEMNRLYQDAFDVLEIELLYGREGLKEIGNLCGISPGPTRFPMTRVLRDADREDIRARLAAWPFTQDLLVKPERRTTGRAASVGA
jgi:4-hydroxy-tetrahydrodipicolinate synthase